MSEPTLMTATIHKDFGDNGGITLRSFGPKLMITRVDEHARFSGLKRGFEVLTINNVSTSVLSEASAQTLLEGDEMVTLLCQVPDEVPGSLVTAVLTKESKSSSVGIGIKINQAGHVSVGSVKPGSLASATPLLPGMIIKSVNNFDCDGLKATQASQLLQQADGKVCILAQVPEKNGQPPKEHKNKADVIATVTVPSEKKSVKMDMPGLEFMSAKSLVDGSDIVLIKKIAKNGPFFGTSLRCGMQVMKIQDVDCTKASGATPEQIYNLLSDSADARPGTDITVIAQKCADQRRAPGAMMVVVVNKESVDTKLGIGLGQKGKRMIINRISDGTLGSTTELEVGMIIHSINNHYVGNKPTTEAGDILAVAEGDITFVVEIPGKETINPNGKNMVAAVMKKESTDTKIGLALQVRRSQLVISKVAPDALAADTPLHPGMKVLQINNVNCTGKKAADAVKLLSEAEGTLTVLAQKPETLPGTYHVSSIPVPQGAKNPSVGITVAKTDDESAYIIAEIEDESLAGMATDLEKGMLLRSINNVNLATKKKLADVQALLDNAPEKTNMWNLLLQTPGGSNELKPKELVTGAVELASHNKVPEDSLNYDDETGKITVTDIGASGFLYGTALRTGMEVVSINNVAASLFSRSGLESILQSQRRLVFLAKQPELAKNVMITEVITKTNANEGLGMGIKTFNGKIYISSIKEGSLASPTKLQPGMELISIDNEDCVGMNAMVVAKFLKEFQGSITIVASTMTSPAATGGAAAGVSYVSCLLDKVNQSDKVGLGLARKRGKLVITKIANNSLAVESDLLVGMEILAINNEEVTSVPASKAAAMLAEAEGTLFILAKRPSLPPGSWVTAAITKEDPDQSIGIKLGKNGAGDYAIKEIKPQSPASFTELEDSMLIISINNVKVKGLPGKEVGALLSDPTLPVITVLAKTTKAVAMGRASYTSMRSLTSVRSLADDTIASASTSGASDDARDALPTVIRTRRSSAAGSRLSLTGIAEEHKREVEEASEATSPSSSKKPTKKKRAPGSGIEEEITLVSKGKRESMKVLNVVEC